MDCMLPQFLTLTLLVAFGFQTALADESQAAHINKIVSAAKSLSDLAQSRVPGQGITNKMVEADVEKVVPDLDPDQLGRLAIICLALYSGDASNVGYDEVYYTGFWVCVDRLFKKGDRDSFLALLYVQQHSGLDGGEKEVFDQRMDKLQKIYSKR